MKWLVATICGGLGALLAHLLPFVAIGLVGGGTGVGMGFGGPFGAVVGFALGLLVYYGVKDFIAWLNSFAD
jgi:hypothetical protein